MESFLLLQDMSGKCAFALLILGALIGLKAGNIFILRVYCAG